jgi:hypothetical protein
MTEQEALTCVHHLGLAVQKIRSNCFESSPMTHRGAVDQAEVREREERFFEGMFPWFFGERCILRAVAVIEGKGTVSGQEFYNLMWVAHRDHEGFMLTVYGLASGIEFNFPEPDPAWIMGWDEAAA